MTTVASRQVDLILQSLDQLPTLSPIAVRLLKITNAADAEFDEVIKLIESDPALSAKILSLCRRADMGAARSITTVRRAAVMLGMEAVHSAVLSVQIYELMQQAPGAEEKREHTIAAFDRAGFWKHSIAVATASEMIASIAKQAKVSPEEAFVAGLVHDLGKLALDWVMPRTYDKIVKQAESRQQVLSAVERAVLGLDHHQAGKRLAEHWSLPHALQDAMWLHEQSPSAMPEVPTRNVVGVVAVANGLCRRLMVGWSGGADGAEGLIDPWCNALGVSATDLAEVANKLHESVADRCRLLGVGEHTPEAMIVESISEANRRLSRMQDQLRVQTRAAAGYTRALSLIGQFAAEERPGGTVSDVLARVAMGWGALMGKPPMAILCQARGHTAREGAQWRYLRVNADGTIACNELHDAPSSDGVSPLELRDLARSSSLGGAFELAQWLTKRLGPSVNVSRLGMLPLQSALGPTAMIVHDQGDAPTIGQQALVTITTIWSWAIGAASQSEGSRRLAEELAQTARELSETQNRLSEAESMARLGEFTSGAAHEMNNPLTIISGRAQMLAERLKTPKDKDDAIMIVRASESMTELITQLHMVARPPMPKRVEVKLPEWAQSVISEARRRTGSVIPVALDIQCSELDATFDASQIGRAVSELLVNALQAAPKTRVIFRIERERNAVPGDDTQKLRVAMIDDGRGMSEHAKKHAFDPFFSDRPAGRGHGLGLALAKRIAETHGGKLTLESRLDRGTVAAISFPVDQEADATGGSSRVASRAA